jgi:prepilin-type processing-associated H-X9-DG protein
VKPFRDNQYEKWGQNTVSGFSMLELLVVVGIMMILTTLYWRSTTGTGHGQPLAACQRNLERLYIAFEVYANDQGGRFPATANARTPEEVLSVLVPHYTADTSLFVCPNSKDHAPETWPVANWRISYAYYMGLRLTNADQVLVTDRQVDALPKASGQLIFSNNGKPPGNNHRASGGNLLFADGHAQASPALAPFPIVPAKNVVLLNPGP